MPDSTADAVPETAARPAPRLILASGSPRRREMLAGLGVAFETRPSEIDETPLAGEPPDVYVRRLAEEKARAVSGAQDDGAEIVLAADTIVALDGRLLGKPRDDDDARRMLADLSAREHDVLTGVAVLATSGELHAAVALTRVCFAPLSPAEIDWYVASGEPLDKAGAYGIQGLGALFVESIAGNYNNVVGLPLPLVYRLLGEAGFSLVTPRT